MKITDFKTKKKLKTTKETILKDKDDLQAKRKALKSITKTMIESDSKTLQMIESWEEFKETAPALKEIRYRRRRTNEGMSRRAFLGGLGSVAAGAALGHVYTKDQQQQSYRENVQQAELFTDRAEQALTAGDIKSACRYFSRAADAYDAAGLEQFAKPMRQLSLDCMKKSGMSQGKGMMEGDEDDKCPPATQNIKLNLKNRQKAIDEYGYGPLNPDMPNTKFWMKKVDEWNLDSADEAKQSLCGNCAAFDQRQHTLDCIAQGIDSSSPNDAAGVINAGELGYCKFLKFKCASRRTCDAWVTGGPLTDQSDSTQVTENLRNWFKEKWVRFGPDGKIRGNCARGSESEGKPKCLPQAKAHALGKKGRASAAARKRREDPNANRTGAAINVATKKKTNEVQLDEKCWDTHRQVGMKKKGGRMVPNCVPKESIEESHKCPECGGPSFTDLILAEKKDACYYKIKASAKVWPSAYASGRLVQCRKKGAANYGNKSESKIHESAKMSSAAVRKLQQLLNKKGANLDVDGVLGPLTVKSIEKYLPAAAKRLAPNPARRTGVQGLKSKEVAEDQLEEKWTQKYKKSINCSSPKGFSQKAHCAGRKKNKGMAEDSEDDKDNSTTAKKPGFIDDVKQGLEDYKDLWMMGATGRTPERWKNSAEKAAERGSAPGPQFPLKEARMKEIVSEFQDYKHLPDMAFQSRYKISKRDWWNKHAKLIQGAGLGIGMDEGRGKIKAKVVHTQPNRAEREHARIRKERGLPDPSYYKTLGDKLGKELAKLRGDDVTEANVDADELVDVYVKGHHKGRPLQIAVVKNFPNKHIDLLTRRLEARGVNPNTIVYGPTTRKVAEDTDQ